jgi:hypothetical protein
MVDEPPGAPYRVTRPAARTISGDSGAFYCFGQVGLQAAHFLAEAIELLGELRIALSTRLYLSFHLGEVYLGKRSVLRGAGRPLVS